MITVPPSRPSQGPRRGNEATISGPLPSSANGAETCATGNSMPEIAPPSPPISPIRTAVTATGCTSPSAGSGTATALGLARARPRASLAGAGSARRDAAGFPASAGVLIFENSRFRDPQGRERPTGPRHPAFVHYKDGARDSRHCRNHPVEPGRPAVECRTRSELLQDVDGSVNAIAANLQYYYGNRDCGGPPVGTNFVSYRSGPGVQITGRRSGPGLPDRFRTSLPDQLPTRERCQNVPALQYLQPPPVAA